MKKKAIKAKVIKKDVTKKEDTNKTETKEPSETPKKKVVSKKAEVKEEESKETPKKVSKKKVPKKEAFSINPILSSFDEIPADFSTNDQNVKGSKIELDVSGCAISNWNGIKKHINVANLNISGTYIADFKGCCDMPKLTTLKFENTPLSNLPFSYVSALYAFEFRLKKINGKEIDKETIEKLKNHPLADELRKKVRDGYLISCFPTNDITDINDICFNNNGFVSVKENSSTNNQLRQGRKRTAEEVIKILNNFTLKPIQSAVIAKNYILASKEAKTTNKSANSANDEIEKIKSELEKKNKRISELEATLETAGNENKALKQKNDEIAQKFSKFIDNYKQHQDITDEELTAI